MFIQDLNSRFFEPAREGRLAKKLIDILAKSGIEIPDFIALSAADAPDEDEDIGGGTTAGEVEEDDW